MKPGLLSVITPTLNNGNMIVEFLQNLDSQTFRDHLEVLILDGGSIDNTTSVARAYGATVIPNLQVLAEPGVNLGMQIAQGEFLMVLAVDNLFHQTDAIERIIATFKNPQVTAAFPRHTSDHTDSIYSRYYNRFTDPYNHFVYGAASNARSFKRVYPTKVRTPEYEIFDYTASPVRPMIALAQGMTLRAPFLRAPEDYLDDCKPILDLIDAGEDLAYVHSVDLIHHTINDLEHFMRKQRWATRNAITHRDFGIGHRQAQLAPSQKWRRYLWPLYALTIGPSTLHALIGFVEEREVLWLLHPLLCFLSASASVAETLSHAFGRTGTTSRK